MLNIKKAAFGAVTAALICGAMAGAHQTGGRVPQTGPKVDSGSPAQAMNIDQLGDMLRSLGYQVKSVTRTGGYVVHELDLPCKGKIVPLDVSLSKDGTMVWLTVFCGQVPQGAAIPANIMQQLLETNNTIAPNFFTMNKTGQIFLMCGLGNRSLPSDLLKRHIDWICVHYTDNENLWNPTKWGAVGGGR